MKLSIIIPVFHEEKNIIGVLEKVEKYVRTPHEVLIIYDLPSDPTYPILKKYVDKHPRSKIRLIQNNQGKKIGVMNAIRTGFLQSRGDACVVLMADLSDDITQIDTMYELFENGWDIVCASRYMKGGKKIGGPIVKTVLSRLAGLTLHYVFKIPTMDSTNAFKLYNRKIFDTITIESTGGFEYSLEIILKAYKKGYTITEIPTVWRDREEGKSNFQMIAWLPQYLKWYFYSFSLPFKKIFSPTFILVLISLFAFILTVNTIGLELRDKITIFSSLDFSWQSDTVERFLHGYILGKDFVFTYGPVFQWMIAIPSIFFHVPSYLSVALFPMVGIIITCILLSFIVKQLVPKGYDSVLLFAYILFVIGLVSLDQLTAVRILLPITYAMFWMRYLKNYLTGKKMILVAAIPSIFGLFSYDIFVSCLILSLLLPVGAIFFAKDKKQQIVFSALFLGWVIGFQLLTSLLITHNADYIKYSLTTVHDYYYVMNVPWAKDRSNILFVFPMILILLIPFISQSKTTPSKTKILLYVLILASLLEIKSGFIRSDAGHIIKAVYPSIITTFVTLYFIAREKKGLLFLGMILFILIPFKATYYNTLAPKNLALVIHASRTKPSFFDLYKMPQNYSYTKADFDLFSNLISHNPNAVFVYPYDNFILNINGSTYNSFALQLYDYTTSLVEQKTMENLMKNPPKFIILGIDTKGVLSLDDIPNITRNPLIFEWMLKNYSVFLSRNNYLILKYNPMKTTKNNSLHKCSLYKLTINLTSANPIENLFTKVVKVPAFMLMDSKIRLPYTDHATSYLLFSGYSNSNEIKSLFDDVIHFEASQTNQTQKDLRINKINPFTQHPTTLTFPSNTYTITCFN